MTDVISKNPTTGANVHKSTFVYDAFSRLRVTQEYNWNGSSWVKQTELRRNYDGMDCIETRDDGNNVKSMYVRSGGQLLAWYTDRQANALAYQYNSKYYYHQDGNGNVTELTDANQNVVANYQYDAYGNVLSSSGSVDSANTFRYSGKEYFTSAGLYNYGYRFYSPGMGRWINRDPIGESGGLNLYGFVGNNPINTFDAYGLWGVQFGCGPNIGVGSPTWILSGNDEAEGAQALADFLNPFGDPYADAGGYNASDPVFNGTRILGAGGAIAGVAAAGVAAVGAVGVGGVASGATAAGAAAERNQPFAMGLRDNLATFAEERGASTWKQLSDAVDWKGGVLNKLSDPNTLVHFNLDGVDVWGGVSRAAAGRGGATDWELLQIRQNPQFWDSLQFWEGGERVANPFR